MKGGPQPRVSSPTPGRSILITSAPRSARSWPHHGPARMRASSSTRTPASGLVERSVMSVRSEESLQARDGAPEDERMHVMRPLVGVHRLEVLRVTHHVILDVDAVAAQHVAGRARNVERLAAIVALDNRDGFRREFILVEQ